MSDTIIPQQELQRQEWYSNLVDECKAIISEATFTSRWALVEGYWNLGKTLRENTNFDSKLLQRVAVDIGISERTVWYALQTFDKYPQLDKLPEGKNVSWHKLVNKYLSEPTPQRPVPLPQGIYDVIYADPPWKYDFEESGNRDIENQYPTMDLQEIIEMSIPSADNSVLFLWATAPKIREALQVMEKWGFVYKTHSIWDKEIIGMGYWFRGQHELLLVGTKGNFSPPVESNRVSSIYKQKRTAHSQKPTYYYDLIEKMYPNSKYLELFARNIRDGWQSWGNQL